MVQVWWDDLGIDLLTVHVLNADRLAHGNSLYDRTLQLSGEWHSQPLQEENQG